MSSVTNKLILIVVFTVILSGCSSFRRLMHRGGTEFTVKISTDVADKESIIEKALKSLESKISAIGLDGEVSRVEGEPEEIRVRIYGDQPIEPIRQTLFTTYQLELRKVVGDAQHTYPTAQAAQANAQGDQEVLPQGKFRESEPRAYFVVEKIPIITGEDIRDARAVSRSNLESDYSILFTLTPAGAERFGAWTEKNIGKFLAIILNKEIQSAPVIKGKITDSGTIEGRFTKSMAEDIALNLKSGYLPATMTVTDEKHFED